MICIMLFCYWGQMWVIAQNKSWVPKNKPNFWYVQEIRSRKSNDGPVYIHSRSIHKLLTLFFWPFWYKYLSLEDGDGFLWKLNPPQTSHGKIQDKIKNEKDVLFILFYFSYLVRQFNFLYLKKTINRSLFSFIKPI